jgi:hypothetical protein
MRINVTARDIKRGEQRHAYSCPIALAARRKFKGNDVLVCLGNLYTRPVGSRLTLSIGGYLPKAAIEWMTQFDTHGLGEPFSFTLKRRDR